ncbi:MAG: hypothetical protein JST55_01285 [Bacteroidetes bacterium]|nr:hypothetical protein [Bacteroidota bacterium]
MYQIFIASVKIHNSDLMLIGGIAFVILWILNRLIANRIKFKPKPSEADHAPGQVSRPQSKLAMYAFWIINIIAFCGLFVLITYLFF